MKMGLFNLMHKTKLKYEKSFNSAHTSTKTNNYSNIPPNNARITTCMEEKERKERKKNL